MFKLPAQSGSLFVVGGFLLSSLIVSPVFNQHATADHIVAATTSPAPVAVRTTSEKISMSKALSATPQS